MAVAIELPQVHSRGHGELVVVARRTAGDKVAVGVHAHSAAALASEHGLWLDVVEHTIAPG